MSFFFVFFLKKQLNFRYNLNDLNIYIVCPYQLCNRYAHCWTTHGPIYSNWDDRHHRAPRRHSDTVWVARATLRGVICQRKYAADAQHTRQIEYFESDTAPRSRSPFHWLCYVIMTGYLKPSTLWRHVWLSPANAQQLFREPSRTRNHCWFPLSCEVAFKAQK